MKRVSKAFVLAMAIFSMMLYVSAFASAASTTGLKDGVFVASGETAKDGSNYKVILTVADGKVNSIDFGKYSGETKMRASFVDYVAEDQRDAFKAEVAEIDEYQEQLNSTLDGSKVVKSSKPVEGLSVYEALATLWKNVVKDAGGSIGEDGASSADNSGSKETASAEDSVTKAVSENPKTGDSSMLVYFVLAGIALIGMVAMGRKRLTA
ncbi:LPXTG cell wall anchor domain-containing protein [Paenibacillus sp. 2TAB23]|uniref:LPXTG cell wall anchor domain-containing protein n=1 Tax=Paenibacillus sp. 2TAB23 TaxID=3233004 RepID=UPI003F987162